MAQSAEHILGKDEVPGSNPGISSRQCAVAPSARFVYRADLFFPFHPDFQVGAKRDKLA